MAEKVAHFTSTLEVTPSLFEVIAQKSLNDTLYDAFRKLVQVLVQLKPNKLNCLLRRYDETFLLLNTLLQYIYLKKYDASFGEHFYNLQRVNTRSKRFSHRDRFLSLILLTILPYLYKKLERIVVRYELEDTDGFLDKSINSNAKRLLYQSHSLMKVTWYGLLFGNYLRYAANQTVYSSPHLRLIQTKLIYSNSIDVNDSFWSALFQKQFSFKQGLIGIIENSLKCFVELGAFTIQFLNVWETEQKNNFYNLSALPLVTSPPKDKNVDIYSGKCPICLQMWKIPTVLSVSGYVFCFACIVKHLKEYECCPVTNLPAQYFDLIRLYDVC